MEATAGSGFRSILVERPSDGAGIGELSEPDVFGDLNLDHVLAAIVQGREEYDLKPFFYAPLHEVGAIRYRHEVLRDLERPAVRDAVSRFSAAVASCSRTSRIAAANLETASRTAGRSRSRSTSCR